MKDVVDRQAAVDGLWDALYNYEDRMERHYLDSDKLDVSDWFVHRNFVQDMNDIDREVINNLPSEDFWTPCEVRLPRVGQSVIFSIDGTYSAEGELQKDGSWIQYRWNWRYDSSEVDAWMPLPQPYKK